MDDIKDRIKKIRKDSHLTQVEFGNRLGVKGNTITGYETGIRTPSDAIIFSICREFNINEDWLRYGHEPMKKVFEGDEYTEVAARIDKDDPKARQAIIKYWKLSDRDKELWWNFVDRFLKNDGAD